MSFIKKNKLLLQTLSEKRPILLKLRSSNTYVFITASFSILTGSIIYSIIIPILPFILDAMNNGVSPDHLDPTIFKNVSGTSTSLDAGVILGLYSAASVVTSPMFGYIGDKVKHRRTPMLFGILALLGTTFLFLFATQYWMFAMARILQGVSDACVYTLSLTLISDTFPRQVIGTQLGRVMLFQSIGMAAGAPIGVLFDKVGYHGPFLFSIILAGVDFLLRLFLIERRNNPKHWFNDKTISQRQHDDTESVINRHENTTKKYYTMNNQQQPNNSNSGDDAIIHESAIADVDGQHNKIDNKTMVLHTTDEEEQYNKTTKTKISMLQLLRDSRILVALLFSLLPFLAISMLEPTLPIRLADEWGYDSSQIGIVYLAQIIPSLIAVPLSGYLYDRYGAKWLCFMTLLLSTITMGCFGIPNRDRFNGSIVPLLVLVILFGFFINMIYTPAYAEITNASSALFANEEEKEDASGSSYGLISTVVCIGNFVGPILGGSLFESIGFFWLCITVASILLVFSPFVVFLGPKRITLRHLFHPSSP